MPEASPEIRELPITSQEFVFLIQELIRVEAFTDDENIVTTLTSQYEGTLDLVEKSENGRILMAETISILEQVLEFKIEKDTPDAADFMREIGILCSLIAQHEYEQDPSGYHRKAIEHLFAASRIFTKDADVRCYLAENVLDYVRVCPQITANIEGYVLDLREVVDSFYFRNPNSFYANKAITELKLAEAIIHNRKSENGVAECMEFAKNSALAAVTIAVREADPRVLEDMKELQRQFGKVMDLLPSKRRLPIRRVFSPEFPQEASL